MSSNETAIVFGVGPGLGWALAKRFANENMRVAAVARDEAKLNSLITPEGSLDIRAYAADVSDSDDVRGIFESVDRDLGEPDLVVFNAGAFQKANVLDIDPVEFERCCASAVWEDCSSGRRPHVAWSNEGVGQSSSPALPPPCAAALVSRTWPFRSSAYARSHKAWPESWDPKAYISAS